MLDKLVVTTCAPGARSISRNPPVDNLPLQAEKARAPPDAAHQRVLLRRPPRRGRHNGDEPPEGGPSLVVPFVFLLLVVRFRGYPRSRVNTDCGSELAWLSMAVPACCRIWSFVKLTISLAMSTSRIRLSEAVRFSS
jgi:hypothetical protein